ncbi:phBC6A51 family helix-turn-helix protein [Lysinibacillus sp. NPDC097287]|uniref:phBC6A51 family helix-turn-helix protein n=1 Tax=Lysinibacillus sp. NPDC097287 TaxID=3364144 RepID=UPI003823BD3A
MTTNKKAQQLIDAISAPYSLSEKQVSLAKKLVKEKMLEGFTVQNFCKENGISTKTYYEWFENPDFNYYVNQLQDAVIPSDENEAFQKIKKHILKIADKPNPSIKEIELFTDTFSYVVEADKRERMEALGMLDTTKPATATSVEERKARLLSRLKG